jgi:hypothetical protein
MKLWSIKSNIRHRTVMKNQYVAFCSTLDTESFGTSNAVDVEVTQNHPILQFVLRILLPGLDSKEYHKGIASDAWDQNHRHTERNHEM